MSYTYNPGARGDALSILRDKGLLDTPARPDPTPGTYLLDAHGHYCVGDDGKAARVPAGNPLRAANDVLPAGGFINWPMIRGAFVALVLCCVLLGLFTIGGK